MSEDNLIAVKILDRTYKIKCPPEQAHELRESAAYIDEQMKKVHQNNSMISADRLAILVALNICHELNRLKRQKNNTIDVMNQRISELQHRIEKFLAVKNSE